MLAVGNWLGMGFVDGWHLLNCTNSAARFYIALKAELFFCLFFSSRGSLERMYHLLTYFSYLIFSNQVYFGCGQSQTESVPCYVIFLCSFFQPLFLIGLFCILLTFAERTGTNLCGPFTGVLLLLFKSLCFPLMPT